MRGGGTSDEEVFRAIYGSLRRFAALVGPREDDPDDLVQDALARTLQRTSLAALDSPERYLRTVILRLASNRRRSLGRWRRAARRLGPEETTEDEFPSDVAELFRLPPAARAVLFLVVIEQRSYREAAQTLGCTEEAARARASRGLRALRLTIEEAP